MVLSIIFNSSLSYYFLDILTSSKINMSKSHEKIYILTGLSLLCLTSVIAFGAEPPVQIATLRWNGDGELMGWRWEKLGEAFEDGAARFAAESRIVSPTWAELDVLGAEVALRCSTNAPSRFLQVSFLRDGQVVSGPIRFEAVAVADTCEAQSLAVSRAKHANGDIRGGAY